MMPTTIVGTENTIELKISAHRMYRSSRWLCTMRCSREYSTQLCGTTMMNHDR